MDYATFLRQAERGEAPALNLLHGADGQLLDDALATATRGFFPDPTPPAWGGRDRPIGHDLAVRRWSAARRGPARPGAHHERRGRAGRLRQEPESGELPAAAVRRVAARLT